MRRSQIFQCEALFNGSNLLQFRRSLRMNQSMFGEEVGLSSVTISKLELGKIKFSNHIKTQIERFFISSQSSNKEGGSGEHFEVLITATLPFLNQAGKRDLYLFAANLIADQSKINQSLKTNV